MTDNTKVDVDVALFEAIEEGNLSKVIWCFKKGADLNASNEDGVTALMYAAWNGHEKVVKLLIKKGARVDDSNKCGSTALIDASRNGHIEVVKLLIEKGANINALNRFGISALIIATRNGHEKVVKLLIENGANSDLKDFDKILNKVLSKASIEALIKALIKADSNGNLEVLEKLIKKEESRFEEIRYEFGDGYKGAVESIKKGINMNDGKKRIFTLLIFGSTSLWITLQFYYQETQK